MAHSFHGGVHPNGVKSLSNTCTIEKMPLPAKVVLSISQHIGAPAKVIVEVGQTVRTGETIAEASGFVSVPLHASISGTVTAIEERVTPLGKKVLSVIIEGNGDDTWAEGLNTERDITSLSAEEMRTIIRDCGIVGMGGAAFPTHVKLSPPSDKPIDTVILNGVECEPYVTSDHRLMLERPHDIVQGFSIIMKILNCKKGYIGIEGNKTDAIKVMRKAAKNNPGIKIVDLKVKYPQGGEKQLIYAITKRKVPAGGLPMDIGCVVQNVATAAAIYNAVAWNKPLIERVVTITGNGATKPSNVLTRIGDSFANLIEFSGGYAESAAKLVAGGPMMGIAQYTDDVPVFKGTSCLLIMTEKEAHTGEELPCIQCAHCVDVCPMKLMPTTLAAFVENEAWDEVKEYGALDCIECGSCTYICPAKRRLVEYIKFGKAKLAQFRAQDIAQKQATNE